MPSSWNTPSSAAQAKAGVANPCTARSAANFTYCPKTKPCFYRQLRPVNGCDNVSVTKCLFLESFNSRNQIQIHKLWCIATSPFQCSTYAERASSWCWTRIYFGGRERKIAAHLTSHNCRTMRLSSRATAETCLLGRSGGWKGKSRF